jgi:hypothetical protein
VGGVRALARLSGARDMPPLASAPQLRDARNEGDHPEEDEEARKRPKYGRDAHRRQAAVDDHRIRADRGIQSVNEIEVGRMKDPVHPEGNQCDPDGENSPRHPPDGPPVGRTSGHDRLCLT